MKSIDTAVMLTQLRTRQKLKVQRKCFSKLTNFYQRGEFTSVSQRVSRAPQAPQALPVTLDQEVTKDTGDEEDRKEGLETREIKELWDHQEREAS